MFKIIDMLTGSSPDNNLMKKEIKKSSNSKKSSKIKSVKAKSASKKKNNVKKVMVNATFEQSFWINQGDVIENLMGLKDALGIISDDTFKYHVNKDKNDFSVWIKEVLNDSELSKKLSKIKSRKSYQKVVDQHIKDNYKI